MNDESASRSQPQPDRVQGAAPAGRAGGSDHPEAAPASQAAPADQDVNIGAGQGLPPTRSRGYFATILRDVTGRWGARIGLLWIIIVLLLAVFGPLIASSHPWLMRDRAGQWSTPLLNHLTPVDITLLVAFFAAIILGIIKRLSFPKRLGIWFAVIAVTVLVSSLAIQEKRAVVLSQYREGIASGQIDRAVFTLIPYSPTDRLPDMVVNPRLRQPGGFPTREAVAQQIVQISETITGLDVPDNAAILGAEDPIAAARQATDRLIERWRADEFFDPGQARRVTQRADQLAAAPLHTQFHLLGTTSSGSDLASRMIHACRIALAIGFIATGIAMAIGIVIGGLMGYFSGIFDLIGMRLVEIFSAVPRIFLLIAFVAFYGRNLYLMMVIIGVTSWVGYAVFLRAEFLRLRQQDFVQAAHACAVPLWSILFRHMLPNGIAPVLVSASFGVASAILLESTLSFLGLGLVEDPSWGQMLNEARSAGKVFIWWMAVFPGLAIFLTIFAYNLVGEALRDAIDPRTRRLG